MRVWNCFLVLLLAVAVAVPLSAQTSKQAKSESTAKSSSGLQSTLEKLERSGWEAFKNKDKKMYGDLVTDDYVGSFADGQPPHDKQSALASMDQITINNYSLSDYKLKTLGPDTALLTYSANVTLTMGNGKPETGKLYVSDLYVKRGGQWKSLHYQETEHK